MVHACNVVNGKSTCMGTLLLWGNLMDDLDSFRMGAWPTKQDGIEGLNWVAVDGVKRKKAPKFVRRWQGCMLGVGYVGDHQLMQRNSGPQKLLKGETGGWAVAPRGKSINAMQEQVGREGVIILIYDRLQPSSYHKVFPKKGFAHRSC